MSDSAASLQAWQGIAAVLGAAIGGFCVALGRRAAGVASRSGDAVPGGDVLQREILTELRQLRADQRAAREAEDDRRRDINMRALDEQIDDIRRELRTRRRGQDDIKMILSDMRDRVPPINPSADRASGDET